MNNKAERGETEAFEETLRLVALEPAPEGLAGRLKARLAALPAQPERRWLWPGAGWRLWMEAAAAAALLGVVIWGGASAYRWVPLAPAGTSLARPTVPAAGFGAAGAVRRPESIVGPVVPAAGNETKSANGSARESRKKHRSVDRP